MEELRDDIARELARFGGSPGIAALVDAWRAAVGPEIARNAWPARVGRDGTLHVHTSSSAWAFELEQLASRIREALGELAPARLRFSIGPLPEPVPDVTVESTELRRQPSPQHIATAAELAAQIDDDDLRKIVAKAAALSLADADSDRRSW